MFINKIVSREIDLGYCPNKLEHREFIDWMNCTDSKLVFINAEKIILRQDTLPIENSRFVSPLYRGARYNIVTIRN